MEPCAPVDAECVGILHDARERRRLHEREVRRRRAEVVARRGFDAIGRAAEVGDVQVAEQDVVLGVLLLDLDGVADLLKLALVPLRTARLRRVQPAGPQHLVACLRLGRDGVTLAPLHQHVLDVLLTDRGAALDRAALRVPDQGAGRADDVDTAVLVVAGVLGRQDRVVHDGRDLIERHGNAVLVVERRQFDVLSGRGIARVDRRRQHEPVDRQVAGHAVEQRDGSARRMPGDRDDRGQGGDDQQSGDHAEHHEADEAADDPRECAPVGRQARGLWRNP